MTRSEWYAQKHAGGWRKALTTKKCDMRRDCLPCENVIRGGDQYFDTNARNHYAKCHRATIKLCAACANEELK